MSRLSSELHRLYLPSDPAPEAEAPAARSLIGLDGRVRAMVLELARPADWARLSTVWQGVQADLELPAPAIAVSGRDGVQLWFSLAQAVPVVQARAVLDALRLRYLGDIDPGRLRSWPMADAASLGQAVHADLVPAAHAGGGWSAFVAQDLAPVFAEEPWLDMPPNPDGQAELLSRLKPIEPDALRRAMQRLVPEPAPQHVPVAAQAAAPAESPEAVSTLAAPVPAPEGSRGPRRFLLDVMNDDRVALPLRIEAAKALLPWLEEPRLP